MLVSYCGLLILWALFLLPALLKQRHFRGFDVPARICYGLLVVDQIMIALKTWYVSSVMTILMIVLLLILIGLVETGFRNKLENQLSRQLVIVISVTFGVDFLLIWLIMNGSRFM